MEIPRYRPVIVIKICPLCVEKTWEDDHASRGKFYQLSIFSPSYFDLGINPVPRVQGSRAVEWLAYLIYFFKLAIFGSW